MNYLVTGGCGFIGANLVNFLLRENPDSITVVDNLSTGRREYLAEVIARHGTFKKVCGKNHSTYKLNKTTVEFIVGDIRDSKLALRVTEKTDAVIHLAAQAGVIPSIEDPMEDMEINVIGTLNLLDACRKNDVNCFIFASSNAPLGEQKQPVDESMAPKPISPYGASKLAGEAYCLAYYGTYGLKTIALRISNVYGPRCHHKDSVISRFLKRALKKEPLVIYGDGNQTRDFLYVDDLCDAILKSVKSDVGGEVFQIGTGKETSINQLAAKIKSLLEKDLGWPIEIIHEERRKGEIMRSCSNVTKAKRLLGFVPKVRIDEGLKKTWEWLKEFYGVD